MIPGTSEQDFVSILGHFAVVLLRESDLTTLDRELDTLDEAMAAMQRQAVPIAHDWRVFADLGRQQREVLLGNRWAGTGLPVAAWYTADRRRDSR